MAQDHVNKQQQFQILVEGLVKDGLSSYIDVIADYMVENELEPKQVKKLISPTLQEKIRNEAVVNKTLNDDLGGSSLPL